MRRVIAALAGALAGAVPLTACGGHTPPAAAPQPQHTATYSVVAANDAAVTARTKVSYVDGEGMPQGATVSPTTWTQSFTFTKSRLTLEVEASADSDGMSAEPKLQCSIAIDGKTMTTKSDFRHVVCFARLPQ